jgi:DNA-binding Lrp family transcriptional regulator
MGLSQKELDIVSQIALDANTSAAKISKETGHREHVVKHSLNKLWDNGTLKLRPFVNPYALGFLEFDALFTVLTPGESALRALVDACVQSGSTTFVMEASGSYHISAMFLARTLSDIPLFFEEIAARAPGVEFEKELAPSLRVTIASPKNFSLPKLGNNTLSYGPVEASHTIDGLDARILSLLGDPNVSSKRQIARLCGVPQSTLEHRIALLQKKQILLGIGSIVTTYMDGLFPYVLRVYTARPSPKTRTLIEEFARSHIAVRSVVETSGAWDYSITMRLGHPGILPTIRQELHAYLGPDVRRIDAYPVTKIHKAYVNPDIINRLVTAPSVRTAPVIRRSPSKMGALDPVEGEE